MIKLRNITASDNPVLSSHQPGYIVDGSKLVIKIGDGTTAWDELPELSGSGGGGVRMTNSTLQVTKWSSNTYSFEDEYPYGTYDIMIFAGDITESQYDKLIEAKLKGSTTTNVITALGDVPDEDIPIIIVYTNLVEESATASGDNMVNKDTVFNEDGSITETYIDTGRKVVTTFADNVITEKVYDNEVLVKTRVTTTSDTTITERVTVAE